MSGRIRGHHASAALRGAVLLTGATGFVGSLVAAVLLGREERRVVALLRQGWQFEDLAAKILAELGPEAYRLDTAELLGRLTILPMSGPDELVAHAHALSRLGITEIVHCAGSTDYFNQEELERTNIQFTDRLLDLARVLQIERFVHVSTAYSSGYIAGPIAESLHPETASDPNEYTRTKRVAEQHVAESGIPYLIIRPSVVIGDSRTGRYSGKDTGLYQYWRGWERLRLGQGSGDIHLVAPRVKVNFLHQDALQNAFQAICAQQGTGQIVNLVSDSATAPTVRALWDMWLDGLGTTKRRHYYDHLSDVPLDDLPRRQRAFLKLAAANMEISAHNWQFENGTMIRLKRAGLDFADATLATIGVCQLGFMDEARQLREADAKAPETEAPPVFA